MTAIEKQLAALHMVAADMESDAVALEGAPFNGTTVAVALGQIMAAVSALANITARHIEAQS
jgi:histidine ammonia-lyase